MSEKTGDRKHQILQTLAQMLEDPAGEKATTAALAGRQAGELLLRRIQGERPEDLQILHLPEIWF